MENVRSHKIRVCACTLCACLLFMVVRYNAFNTDQPQLTAERTGSTVITRCVYYEGVHLTELRYDASGRAINGDVA